MKAQHVRQRLHDAVHRSGKVFEEELAEDMAVIGDLTAEPAEVIAELAGRLGAVEAAIAFA